MLHPPLRPLKRILLSLDSIGGVWRYALDLAEQLQRNKIKCFGLGIGPRPNADQLREAAHANMPLEWSDLPLDWQEGGADALAESRQVILATAKRLRVDALHLDRLALAHPILSDFTQLAVAHSCLPTYWRTLRPSDKLPAAWLASARNNHQGLLACDHAIAPTHAHAQAVRSVYDYNGPLAIIHNSARSLPGHSTKEPFVVSAARWWDEAKNAACLDAAAANMHWPLTAIGATQSDNGASFVFHHADATGSLNPSIVRKHMQRAAIFVSPSRYEPFGLAALEAAHDGCALVLADIPTYRELWDGAALFFDACDPAALACAVNTLIADEKLLLRQARAAMLRARLFSREQQTAKIIALHHHVLNRNETHAGAV